MNENLKAFIQKASEDVELQDKIEEMNESILKEAKLRFIKLAADNGFVFTEADIDELYLEGEETSEDELKAVSGGAYTSKHWYDGRPYSGCHCKAFGGGSKDQYQKTCACIGGGCGKLTDYGMEKVRAGEIHYVGNNGAPVAMFCAVHGQGQWDYPV